MPYKHQRNYENINKHVFAGVGKWDIPPLQPVQYEDCDFIGFNYAKNCKTPGKTGIHFFLDDYQFARVWKRPEYWVEELRRFKYVLTPDFSMYTDFPMALQLYNHYRKQWTGAYMQRAGIQVIATAGWSTPESYDWCFDGLPENSCIAVSSVGCMMECFSKMRFIDGYKEMQRRIRPSQILFWGSVPEECDGNIIEMRTFQSKFRRIKEG